MSLDDLLALLPDNTTGDISAADLRTVVTELWNYTVAVQTSLSEVVVTGLPAAQAAIAEVQGEVDALEVRVEALEATP